MTKLKIGVIDLVSKGPTSTLWARIMYANLASIMPQVVATWCEQEGHEVKMICYTRAGRSDAKKLPENVDLAIYQSIYTCRPPRLFTQQLFPAARGAVTVGGPHARCYPDDSIKYFDYV